MAIITTDINLVIQKLQQGNPVAIPTETVYGLAATYNSEDALKAVFALKNRPLNHPLIMHVAHNWDLNEVVQFIPDYAKKLMKKFWPGPLTLVFNCKADVLHPLVNAGQNSVAIRCPAHPIAQHLLQQLQIPLVAPSANPFGKVSPTTAEHVNASFPNDNLLILDGGRCEVGIESTIIDATQTESYQVLRQGMISEQDIRAVIHTSVQEQPSNIVVSGTLETHYQPEKPLYYWNDIKQLEQFCQNNTQKKYLLGSKKLKSMTLDLHHHFLDDVQQSAFDLYYQLRHADTLDVDLILIELPPACNPWRGLRERILKAGTALPSS